MIKHFLNLRHNLAELSDEEGGPLYRLEHGIVRCYVVIHIAFFITLGDSVDPQKMTTMCR